MKILNFYISFDPEFTLHVLTGNASSIQFYLRQTESPDYDPNKLPCGEYCDLFVFGIKSRKTGIVLGSDLLTGYDVVYDRENLRIGFAPTTCDLRDTREGSSSQPQLVGPEMRGMYSIHICCMNGAFCFIRGQGG